MPVLFEKNHVRSAFCVLQVRIKTHIKKTKQIEKAKKDKNGETFRNLRFSVMVLIYCANIFAALFLIVQQFFQHQVFSA